MNVFNFGQSHWDIVSEGIQYKIIVKWEQMVKDMDMGHRPFDQKYNQEQKTAKKYCPPKDVVRI